MKPKRIKIITPKISVRGMSKLDLKTFRERDFIIIDDPECDS